MIKWTLSAALGLFTLASQAQVVVTENYANVTIVVNGRTYSGSLPVAPAATIDVKKQDATTTKSSPTPRLTANLPTAPTPMEPVLPAQMMTAAWPLNQAALMYPDGTRNLNSSYGDGQFTPKPIASTLKAVFGANHIVFDTTMPWVVIDSAQTPDVFTTVLINHPEWGSDDGATCSAMPAQATVSTHWPARPGIIEGANNPTGDRHVLVMDVASSRLYELFGVNVGNPSAASPSYSADSARCWDVSRASQGLPGQNSADAAGLPILPLLLRFQEATSGLINHALRFTVNLTRANGNGGVFSAPASHASGNNWSSMAYMGMRLRLRSDFDATPYSAVNQTIIEAMKTYGIVVADNGITGLVTSDNDARWNADDLHMLSVSLTLADFTPVNSGAIIDSTGTAAQ